MFKQTHSRASRAKRKEEEKTGKSEIEILYTRYAGFDVPKKTVRVCLLMRDEHDQSHKELCTYGTTTEEVLQLSTRGAGCDGESMRQG